MSVVVACARSWLGTPYVHGGSVRGAGCDCLGLLRGVWRELAGEEPEPVPPYAPDWAEAARDEVLLRAALRHLRSAEREAPGQMVLFRMRRGAVAKHVGIQSRIGPEAAFIHAYCGHGVVESALTEPWRRRIAARFDLEERIG